MKEIPFLEWPEQPSPLEEERVTEAIIDLLRQQVESQFQNLELIFLVSPHPARNTELLDEKLTKFCIDNKIDSPYQVIKYGYKNRGWAVVFSDIQFFKETSSLFFNHGAENLIIASIDNSKNISENPDLLADTIKEIVFEDNKNYSTNSYSGLFFECDRLVSFI